MARSTDTKLCYNSVIEERKVKCRSDIVGMDEVAMLGIIFFLICV